jgi:hypothetical protein
VDELTALLDRLHADHPLETPQQDDLQLKWVFWNVEDQGLPPYFGAEAICRLDRKPLLVIDGPVPEWLDQPEYLRQHLRQFIWKRGEADVAPRITVRQLEPRRCDLATIDLADVTPERLSELLDEAWQAYMLERPLIARGYIDNEHGNWLRRVMEGAHEEELRVQDEAQRGVLQPPGREVELP